MERVIKKYFVSLNLLIIITFIIGRSSATEFDYKNADSWVQINQQCGGQRQSPVSINYGQLDRGSDDMKFTEINYYNKPLSAQLSNTGHTIKMDFEWDENQTPYIAEGFLGENEYVLDSIYFHWSRNSSEGSEHIIGRSPGVMEMHLVHYNRNYGSFQNALNYDDGLAIIGGIFDLLQRRRRRDDDYENLILAASQSSPALDRILHKVKKIRTPGSSVNINPFPLSEFRPVQLSENKYITYYGSLTLPPCTENVLWLLAVYPYQMTELELEALQEMVELNHGDDHNNRPVQPLNGRKVSVAVGAAKTTN